MNSKIKEHLTKYATSKGWGTSDKDLFEIIQEGKRVYEEKVGSHRWYDDLFVVVMVDGMLIGYNDFYMTGDNNASDMDLDYDMDSICEVEKKTKTVEYYEPLPNVELKKELA